VHNSAKEARKSLKKKKEGTLSKTSDRSERKVNNHPLFLTIHILTEFYSLFNANDFTPF